jgi:hypothetical protein
MSIRYPFTSRKLNRIFVLIYLCVGFCYLFFSLSWDVFICLIYGELIQPMPQVVLYVVYDMHFRSRFIVSGGM